MNIDSLTAQEREVFLLMIQGKSNAEISQAMFRTVKTIKQYITAIFKKLQCKTRSQLIARHYMEQAP